jgi:hypothetical protein
MMYNSMYVMGIGGNFTEEDNKIRCLLNGNDCLNGGQCLEVDGIYSCYCPRGNYDTIAVNDVVYLVSH